MAAEAKEESRSSRMGRPWMSMKVELKGVGGILVLGGAIVAAAFAAHRARAARRRRAAAAATPQVRLKGQEEERWKALPGSGLVADGAQGGDGGLFGATLTDERKEQIPLTAGDDVEKSYGFVLETEKADVVISQEDGTLREPAGCSLVSTEQQIGEIKSEESVIPLDGSKFFSPSESSPNKSACKQMQVISDGFMTLQELEEDDQETEYHPELGIEEAMIVHVPEIEEDSQEEPPATEPFEQVEELSDGEASDMKDEESALSLVSYSSSSSSESNAEQIWPAEVIEQEKSVISADLINQSDISEEVEHMVPSEDSGELGTDTTLTEEAESEEMKPKANATGIRLSTTIAVFNKKSEGLLRRRRRLLLLLLVVVATALGLISLLDQEHFVPGHLTELCNKFFAAIFASSDE